jgi:integrase
MGYLYRRGNIWWVKYYVNGAPRRESTGTEKQEEARRFLKLREGAVGKGAPVAPRLDRILYEEVAKDLREHYRTTGKRDLEEAGYRLAHLYVAQRQAEEAENGTINRELAVLNRMLRLAYENGKLLRMPIIRILKENGPRQGFFGEIEFLAVQNQLQEYLRAAAAFAYVTGWRKQEVLGLTWERVDLQTGIVRLEPGSTKNWDGRTVVLPEPLREVLTQLWQEVRSIATPREIAAHVPWVFLRHGQRIRNFRRAWAGACSRAKIPGRLFHDFRRTGVRNMVRAGIPERVAMAISGHWTRSVFDRYNIVAEGYLHEAARKLAGTISGTVGAFALDPRPASV